MKNKILSVVLAVLCVLSMVPFTAFADDAVTFEQYFEVHNFTKGTSFESPNAGYTRYGYVFETNAQFDDETVTAITRDPNYPDVISHKVLDGEDKYQLDFTTNLFSYDGLFIDGEKVSLFDSQYVVIDYYYDRHEEGAEDLGDNDVTEIVDKNMVFAIEDVMIDGKQSYDYKIDIWASSPLISNSPIKADKWDTIVFDLGAHFRRKGLPENYLTPAGDSLTQMGMFRIYIFGKDGGVNLHDDDAFYIKSIRFMSYDPTTEPSKNISSENISIEVLSDEEGSDWIYWSDLTEDTYNLLDTYTLPEFPEEILPEGGAFVHYQEANTGMIYNAGDTVTLNWGKSSTEPLISYQFYPVFSGVETIKFTVDDDNSFTKKWALDAQVTLPDAPEAPEGQRFAGWNDGEKTYLAGSNYDFTTAGVSFTAVFVDADTYYVSADGAIDGVSAYVYTSLDEAENAIAADDGIGTILVEGDVSFKAMTFESSEVTVKGYNNDARVIFCETNSIYTGNDADLIFDDIIIKRHNSANDENWLCLRDIHLTFGEGCGYEKGERTNFTQDLYLYISQYEASSVGYSITNNSDAVDIAIITPDGKHSTQATYTGDVNIEINAGVVRNAFLGTRNGNGDGTPNTRTGNVSFTMNGGTVKKFFISHYPVILNGDATAIFNGGTITNRLVFGDEQAASNGVQSSISGTLTYVINAADMTAAPTVQAGYAATAGTSILVYNNAELAETPVEDGVVADYIVLTRMGVATPVKGQPGKFTIVADDSAFDQVLANGKVIEADNDGYYTLDEGKTTIQFLSNAKVNVSIDGVEKGQEPAGSLYTLPEGVAPEGKVFIGWMIGDEFYEEGAQYTLPSEDGATVEIISYTVDEDEHIYVDAKNGDDANIPFLADKAVKSMAAAAKFAAGFANPIIHVIGTYEAASLNLPAHTGVVTVTGETTDGVLSYTNTGLYISSDVVFENIGIKSSRYDKFIEAQGHNITFGEGTYAVQDTSAISIHAGVYNQDQIGNQEINVNAPIGLANVNVGPYYIKKDTTKTYTGDFALNINAAGASVKGVSYGDAYSVMDTTDPENPVDNGPRGTFTHNGNVVVNVADGASLVKADSAGTNTTTTGNFVVYNYGETTTTCVYGEDDVTHVFNFVDGVEVESYENGILTVAEPAYDIASGTNSDDNKLELASGAYSIRKGKSLKTLGLNIEGAQIRLQTEDVPQGLRFIANYTDELAAEYAGCEYGFVVIPTSVVGNNSVAVGATFDKYTVANIPAKILYADCGDYVQYTVCLTGLEVEQYKTEYTAVPYVLVDGEYIYGEQYSTSVYKVAQAVVADETASETDKASMQDLIDLVDALAEAE